MSEQPKKPPKEFVNAGGSWYIRGETYAEVQAFHELVLKFFHENENNSIQITSLHTQYNNPQPHEQMYPDNVIDETKK